MKEYESSCAYKVKFANVSERGASLVSQKGQCLIYFKPDIFAL